MSILGKNLRGFLMAAPDCPQKLPGGISPEIAPAGVKMPFMVYTGATSERVVDLSGKVYGHLESVSVVFTTRARSECESLVDWLAGLISAGRPSNSTDTHHPVKWWRLGGQGDVSEVILDGEDESIRQVSLDLIGFVVIDR